MIINYDVAAMVLTTNDLRGDDGYYCRIELNKRIKIELREFMSCGYLFYADIILLIVIMLLLFFFDISRNDSYDLII